DGGLETTMYDAQTQLADAYLAAGQAAEARAIAEDLVAREPWEAAHIDRFRRALVMLRVSEPDTVIAERLSGATPFVATDHFSEAVEAPATPPQPGAGSPPPVQPPQLAETTADAPVSAASTVSTAGESVPHASGEIDLSSALGELEESDASSPPRPP